MPKADNLASQRVNLDFKSISTRKTKALETTMAMKKRMVKMNVKKILSMLTPGPRLSNK